MFGKTGSTNREQHDSACVNRLRRETSGATAYCHIRHICYFYEEHPCYYVCVLSVYKYFEFCSIKIIEKIIMKYKIP